MKVMYFPTFTPLKYPQIQQYGLKVLNTKDDFKPYSDQMCDTQKNHAKLESYFWHFLTIYEYIWYPKQLNRLLVVSAGWFQIITLNKHVVLLNIH